MNPSPSEQPTCRTVELWARPWICQTARILARQRTTGHDHTRKAHEDTGDNELVDVYGLLAELLLLDGLERWGLRPKGYVMLADRAPNCADFELDGKTYDIKAALPGKSFVCCNERQRLTRLADFYVPVAFERQDYASVYKPIPASVVASWPLRQGHSPYRSIALSALQPISCLLEVPQA
jgi:hypothetical protein